MTKRLLDLPEPPTAIFAASDVQAMGILETAYARGARVPHDLAVVGFDDLEVAATLGLTTVRQPLRETGSRAAELLLTMIEGAASPPVEELASLQLIERRTT